MNHPNDYIKLNDNNTSRPIIGVYELSSILTNTSELLANTPNLNEFLKDDDKMINDFINPSELALELFKQGIFDAYIKRDNDTIKYSESYTNPNYLELLSNYHKRQRVIRRNYVNKLFE